MAIQLLGEVLVKKGFIDRQKLNEVLRESPHSEEMLGKVLLKKASLTKNSWPRGLPSSWAYHFIPT